MRRKDDSKKAVIVDYIRTYFLQHNTVPSVREIAAGADVSPATVHRYLVAMKEAGELEYNGRRSVSTQDTRSVSGGNAMPVLGFVACGPGQEEEEQFLEYIRMPERLVGNNELFALIAKGESMVDAGVHPGDYVIVRRQNTAKEGDLIIALSDGKNNLKQLHFDTANQKYVLRSRNADKEAYPDIVVDELQVQGVVVGAYHAF